MSTQCSHSQPSDHSGNQASHSVWSQTFRFQFLRCSQKPGSLLDTTLQERMRSLQLNNVGLTFCSGTPFQTMITSRLWNCICLLQICSLLFFGTFQGWFFAASETSFTSKQFRLSALRLRDGSQGPNITSAGVSEFGMLMDACRVSGNHSVLQQNNSILLAFEEEQTASGWFYRTHKAAGSDSKDIVSFMLEASQDGKEWRQLTQNHQCRTRTAPMRAAFLEVPSARGEVVSFEWNSLACRWPLLLGGSICGSLDALLVAYATYFSWNGQAHRAIRIFGWGFCLMALVRIFNSMAFAMIGRDEHIFWSAGYGLSNLLFPGSVLVLETRFLELAILNGVWFFVIELVQVFVADCGADSCPYNVPVNGLMFICIPFAVVVVRERARMIATRQVQKDREILETAQLELQKEAEELSKLKVAVQQLSTNPIALGFTDTMGNLIQRQPEVALAPSAPEVACVEPNKLIFLYQSPLLSAYSSRVISCTRIKSLDHLYTASAAIHPILLEKAKGWAYATKGQFPLLKKFSEKCQFVQWFDAQNYPDLSACIEWPGLKPVDRAISKLVWCYGGDVSRLLDISRARIVFASVAELAQCLDLIAVDSEVMVVAVKNRLTDVHSQDTAGWRDLRLTLRILTDETKALGLSDFLCELQLVPESVLSLQRSLDGQHDRYLEFRNSRSYREYGPYSAAVGALARLFFFRSQLRIHRFTHGWQPKQVEADLRSVSIESTGTRRVSFDSSTEGSVSLKYLQTKQHRRGSHRGADSPICRLLAEKDSQTNRQKEILIHRFLWPGDMLDRTLNDVGDSLKLAWSDSLWFSSKPLITALGKKPFQALLVLVAIVYTYWLLSLESIARQEARHFRLSVLKNIDGSSGVNLTTTDLLGFKLLLQGCPVLSTEPEVAKTQNNTIFSLSYASQVAWDGWAIEVGRGNPNQRPVQFQLDVSRDGLHWDRAWFGMCNEALASLPYSVPCELGSDLRYENDTAVAGMEPTFSITLPWYAVLFHSGQSVWFPLCICAIAVLAISGRYHWAKSTMVVMVIANGIVRAACAYMAAIDDRAKMALFWYLLGFFNVIQGVLFHFFEAHIFEGLIVQSLLLILVNTLYQFIVLDGRFAFGLHRFAVLPAVVGAVGIAVRAHVLRRTNRIMEQDRDKYDHAWNELKKSTSSMEFETISELTSDLNSHRIEPRQAIHASSSHRLTAASWRPQDKVTGVPLQDSPPVESLDQLYAQAGMMHPFLMQKVAGWATSCNGFLPCQVSTRAVKFMSFSTSTKEQVKWAHLKSVDRATQKIAHCYGGTVAKLLDVCRQALIFEAVGDLRACLQKISKDMDIEVLRVRNRLSDSFSSKRTAGYRDVVVNVRIVTEDTKDLGCDGHVCEVSLVPMPIFELRCDHEAHSRYLDFRNRRGDKL